MERIVFLLVAMYRYQNFAVRTMHPLLDDIEGVEPHSIFLKHCGVNVLRRITKKEEKIFIDIVDKLNPAAIGFSVLSPYIPTATRLTRLIKRKRPNTLVVWGGIHPTIMPEDCVKEADIVCVGEGEGAILDLAVCLRDRKPYQHINNLWFREGDRITKNPMRPLIQDLDSLPFPSYGNSSYYFVDNNNIKRNDPMLLDDALWVLTSRGCPYMCSYCVNSLLRPTVRNLGPYLRRRSVDNVIRELKDSIVSEEHNKKCVFFADEVFATDESWLDEFAPRYKKEIGLPFYAEYNPKQINKNMVSKLSNAGLDTIYFGIQTGSDYIRNNIFTRPGKNTEIIALANKLKEHNVNIKYDLIIDNPYDTEESLKETVELLLQLPRPLYFSLFSLQFFPNYPITVRGIKDKVIKPKDVSIDILAKKGIRNFCFVPTLFPYDNKHILQNIIWLIVFNHANTAIVKYAVFSNSPLSGALRLYLNFKAVVLGTILGYGRCMLVVKLTNVIKHIINGEFRILYIKARKRLFLKMSR